MHPSRWHSTFILFSIFLEWLFLQDTELNFWFWSIDCHNNFLGSNASWKKSGAWRPIAEVRDNVTMQAKSMLFAVFHQNEWCDDHGFFLVQFALLCFEVCQILHNATNNWLADAKSLVLSFKLKTCKLTFGHLAKSENANHWNTFCLFAGVRSLVKFCSRPSKVHRKTLVACRRLKAQTTETCSWFLQECFCCLGPGTPSERQNKLTTKQMFVSSLVGQSKPKAHMRQQGKVPLHDWKHDTAMPTHWMLDLLSLTVSFFLSSWQSVLFETLKLVCEIWWWQKIKAKEWTKKPHNTMLSWKMKCEEAPSASCIQWQTKVLPICPSACLSCTCQKKVSLWPEWCLRVIAIICTTWILGWMWTFFPSHCQWIWAERSNIERKLFWERISINEKIVEQCECHSMIHFDQSAFLASKHPLTFFSWFVSFAKLSNAEISASVLSEFTESLDLYMIIQSHSHSATVWVTNECLQWCCQLLRKSQASTKHGRVKKCSELLIWSWACCTICTLFYLHSMWPTFY